MRPLASDITARIGSEPIELGRGLELRPDWYPPRSGHPVDAYLSRLDSRSSRQVQASALEQLVQRVLGIRPESGERRDLGLRWRFPWHLVRPQQAARIRQALADPDPLTGKPYALATQNRMLVAFRRVLKECWRLGHLSADDYARTVDLPAFRGERLPRGRAVSEGELRSLFLACGQDLGAAGRRDAALFTLLRAGLRRAEAAALQLDDWEPESGDLKVAGKGNRQRLVSIPPSGRRALEDWVAIRGPEPGPLLWRIRKGDRVEAGVGISGAAVAEVLERRRREVLVSPLTPHDWRRSFVGDLLDAGADLAIVQQLAGHASPATTARYDRRPDVTKRRAAALLHVPYVPPVP